MTNRSAIPTPAWRKIDEGGSEATVASTFIADGLMGRSRPVPRGIYAMGAPRAVLVEV